MREKGRRRDKKGKERSEGVGEEGRGERTGEERRDEKRRGRESGGREFLNITELAVDTIHSPVSDGN